MLSKLLIKNVALMDQAEIEFSDGLNVLSGETGAGKSVILESLNFVLGAKADKTLIRYGESECMVKAEFLVDENSVALERLKELDIDSDGEIIISRKFQDNGKSSIKINGNTVTASMLRTVTDYLVDVHGQSEHFYLLSEDNQLKTLDNVAKNELNVKKDELIQLLREKHNVLSEIKLIGGSEEERARKLDLLDFQINEIKKADLKDGEEDELQQKKIKISNVEKIANALKEATECLSGENGSLTTLQYAMRSLNSISKLDPKFEELSNRLESLIAEVDDVNEIINDNVDELYFDENEIETIEERLDVIRDMKRKYGPNLTDVYEFLEKAEKEYDLLSDSDAKYIELQEKIEKLNKKIYRVCNDITDIRKKYALIFSESITRELKTLNMPNAVFAVDFNEYSISDIEKVSQNGLDDIKFVFSANAGEPVKPMSKIISGGEMSRFMLALKTCLKDVNGISTYIFDEIDAGISGKTAKVVAEKFAEIAKYRQIIAVSHLAQIAVMSDRELLIEKTEENGKTHSRVKTLSIDEKIDEIIRLLGGNESDEFARRHAEELILQANTYKKSLNN